MKQAILQKLSVLILLLACASVGHAQTTPTNVWNQTTGPAIYGTVQMDYKSRQDLTGGDGQFQSAATAGQFQPGDGDTYTINMRAGTVGFVGTMVRYPTIKSNWKITQKGHIDFQIQTGIVTNHSLSPDSPVTTGDMRTYGMWAGVMPVTESNICMVDGLSDSPQRFAIKSVGNDAAFTSPFSGSIIGRQERPKSFSWSPMKVWQHINGQDKQITIAQPDPMTYSSVVIGAGPRQTYSAVTCTGNFIYARDTGDYTSDPNNNPIKCSYTYYDNAGAHQVTDTITGTMHFDGSTQDKDYKSHYDVDLRWNDKAPITTNDDQAAAAPAPQINTDDEAAATTAGTNEHSLHGRIDFVDTPPYDYIKGVDEPSPMGTKEVIKLDRTNLTNAQVVAFAKLFIEEHVQLTDE